MEKITIVCRGIFRSFLLTLSLIKTRLRYYDHLVQVVHNYGYEPGHYYSPIPDLTEIEKDAGTIFMDKDLADIDLNLKNQLILLEELKKYYPEYPYVSDNLQDPHLRYKKEGAFYRFSDSVFLYSILRRFTPRKIIEIGSGHSSAIMLDTNDRFCTSKIHCTFIEPFPEERLLPILTEADRKKHTIIPSKVQEVKLENFQTLEANDILFIDSTHVSKVGSDVNYLLFEVLPVLKPGVLIHIHDIFYPFELPKHWILEKHWFWNENYLLRAFLMNNPAYEILVFNTYLQKIKYDWFRKEMPECLKKEDAEDETGCIWLRKIA